MIVVILADPRSGQANLTFEGGSPEMVHELLYNMTDNLGKQLGKAPLPKPSGLVVTPAGGEKQVVDLKARLDAMNKQGTQQ